MSNATKDDEREAFRVLLGRAMSTPTDADAAYNAVLAAFDAARASAPRTTVGTIGHVGLNEYGATLTSAIARTMAAQAPAEADDDRSSLQIASNFRRNAGRMHRFTNGDNSELRRSATRDTDAPSALASAATLLRAAEILEREAECLSSSYVVSTMTSDEPTWDDQDAKRDHDEMLVVAGELRKSAA